MLLIYLLHEAFNCIIAYLINCLVEFRRRFVFIQDVYPDVRVVLYSPSVTCGKITIYLLRFVNV